MDESLLKIYADVGQPGSLSSPRTLANLKGIPLSETEKVLQTQDSYTLHRNRRIRAPEFRKTIAYFPLDSAQMDLFVLDKNHERYNKPYRYILVVISIFSRYASAVPLKTKTGAEVAQALDTVLEGQKYKKLQSDRGKEFINPSVKKVLVKHQTELYHSHSPNKAAIAERFIRTLRLLISRYCTLRNTFKFIEELQNLIKVYNERPHRSLQNRTPLSVHNDQSAEVFNDIYSQNHYVKTKKPRYAVGETVRINRSQDLFEKANYTWSTELFRISRILDTIPITYRLRDLQDEEIQGGFYESEISKVADPGLYKIEKVLKSRTVNGDRQLLVRWLGYSSAFDSWIPAKDVQNV